MARADFDPALTIAVVETKPLLEPENNPGRDARVILGCAAKAGNQVIALNNSPGKSVVELGIDSAANRRRKGRRGCARYAEVSAADQNVGERRDA
jgi:hypothetical protein